MLSGRRVKKGYPLEKLLCLECSYYKAQNSIYTAPPLHQNFVITHCTEHTLPCPGKADRLEKQGDGGSAVFKQL